MGGIQFVVGVKNRHFSESSVSTKATKIDVFSVLAASLRPKVRLNRPPRYLSDRLIGSIRCADLDQFGGR
jgi:hypothetical protein